MSAFSRLIERTNVDLPQPDGPMRAVTARVGIVMLTSYSACLPPYQNEKSWPRMVPGCRESGIGNPQSEESMRAGRGFGADEADSRVPIPDSRETVIRTAR